MGERGFLVAVGGAAIVVAGLAGCGSNESTSSETTTEAESTTVEATETASATAAPGEMKVTIDGQDQNVAGTVTCATMAGNVNIAIGEGTTGIAAVVSEADPPVVQSVVLGNVNGVTSASSRVCRKATPRPRRTATPTPSPEPRPAWIWPTRCNR